MEHVNVVQVLDQAWKEDLLRAHPPKAPGSKPWRPENAWAGKMRKCTRAIYLGMEHPEDDPWDRPEQIERGEQGNEAERAMLARLARMGPFATPRFSIIQQQHRFEYRDRDGLLLYSGKMDGRLAFADGPRVPVEFKSGRTYESATTIEDLDRSPWGSLAVDQILMYLFADDPKNYPDGEPFGLIVIRVLSDFPTIITVRLMDFLSRVEGNLQRCREAVLARKGKGPIPDFTELRAECKRCPHFGKSCAPPVDFGPGLTVVTDPDGHLEGLAQIAEANKQAHRDYERAWDLLKENLRGIESGLLGNYQISGAWQARMKYSVPDEVKAQYGERDPRAAFTLKIEPLR